MTTALSFVRESSIGTQARSLRISLHLTEQALANMAGVSKEEVGLLEDNLPIPLYIKNKLLKKLYAAKSARKYHLQLTL